jgi:hypothetical protein
LLENCAKIKSLKKDFELELIDKRKELKNKGYNWDLMDRVLVEAGHQQLKDDILKTIF